MKIILNENIYCPHAFIYASIKIPMGCYIYVQVLTEFVHDFKKQNKHAQKFFICITLFGHQTLLELVFKSFLRFLLSTRSNLILKLRGIDHVIYVQFITDGQISLWLLCPMLTKAITSLCRSIAFFIGSCHFAHANLEILTEFWAIYTCCKTPQTNSNDRCIYIFLQTILILQICIFLRFNTMQQFFLYSAII